MDDIDKLSLRSGSSFTIGGNDMKRLIALFCLWIASYAFANPVYFTSDPTLTPDGEKIIFNFEGDLWIVPSAGGTAYRLTGMEGRETNPRVSPDGKWLAFTAEQDGNDNVYIMPVEGGKIEQLTYNSGFDRVDSWSFPGPGIQNIFILPQTVTTIFQLIELPQREAPRPGCSKTFSTPCTILWKIPIAADTISPNPGKASALRTAKNTGEITIPILNITIR